MPKNPINLSPDSFLSLIKTLSNLSLPVTFYGNSKLKHFSLVIISKFFDESHPCLPVTISANNTTAPNPEYHTWTCQDKLIFGVLVGSLTLSIILLIQQAKTSCEAWTTLANTYARPYWGHIKKIKEQLKQATKGSQTITKYMRFIKTCVEELTLLGKPVGTPPPDDAWHIFLSGLSPSGFP